MFALGGGLQNCWRGGGTLISLILGGGGGGAGGTLISLILTGILLTVLYAALNATYTFL